MKKLLLLLVLVLAASIGFAQLNTYAFNYTAGTYTEITGGTVLGTCTVGGSGVTSLDNVTYFNVPLPFLFGFNGRRYSQIAVNSNGYIIVNGSVAFGESSQISSTTVADGVIVAYGKDNQGIVIDGSLGTIRYETIGAAPNRIFVVQWKNFRDYNASGDVLNFQIRLYEANNAVEFAYGNVVVVNSETCQVGMRGITNADYINRTTTTNWAATTAGTANSSTMTVSSTVKPADGMIYTFTPPAPAATPNLATVISPTNGATNVFGSSVLSWADGGGWTNGFKLYFGTDNPPTNLVNGVDLGYVTSYDPPGDMAYSTPHYWKVVPYNGFGDNTGGAVWSFTTSSPPLTGTKTIGGEGANYATFTAAINDLNGAGVGAGGVTFVVANGTYNENPPAINASGTAANQIKFQAAPGANPVVTPTGGTGSFGFKLNGADYVTFDNIDITGPATLVYGYWLAGLTNDGANNNTIKNCTITMAYTTTTNYGIYSLGVTNGANSGNVFQGNSIIAPFNGIYFTGSSTAGSEAQGVTIQGNVLTNMRNYGIYAGYVINGEVTDNQVSFFNAATSAYYGIYVLGTTSTITVADNTISGGYTSGTVYGIYSSSGTNVFGGNIITNIYNTGSSGWYGFYAGGGTTTWYDNRVYGIANTGTAVVYTAYITTGNHEFYNNELYDIATGGLSLYGFYVIGGTTNSIHRNQVYNLRYTGTGTGVIYGIHIGGGTTNNVYNNMVYDLRATGSTSAATSPAIRALSITSGTTNNIWHNTVFLNSSGTSANFSSAGLYIATSNTIDIKNNIFVNKSIPGSSGRTVALWKTTAGVSNFSTGTDKNIYYAGIPGAANLIGYFSTTPYVTLEDYKTMTVNKDQGSYTEDVPFLRSEEPYDLHIEPNTVTRVESNAVPIAMVTVDIDGDPRGVMPDIGADEGAFTAPEGAPSNVTLVSPADGATNLNPNNLVVSWTAPMEGATPTYYGVFISETEEDIFSGFYAEVNAPVTQLNLSTVDDLELGFQNTWYWAVQAFNADGESDPDDPSFEIWSFSTTTQMQASNTHNLGNVWPGGEKDGVIAVQNIGSTPLSFEATGSDEFRFNTPGRYTIPANSSLDMPYTFTAPELVGPYTGNITLTETNPGDSEIQIAVTGNISSDVSVGTGTSNLYLPVYPYFGYTYSQVIYPAAWFNYPDGYRIERLQYYWNPAQAPLNTTHFQVWMGHTTQSSFPSTGATWVPISQMTLVFDGNWSISAGAGWKELVLSTPFLYNRTDNLIIAMYEDTPGYDTSGNTTSSFFHGTNTTGTYHGVSYYSDTAPGSPIPPNPTSFTATSRQGYPNTRFVLGAVPTAPQITVSPTAWNYGTVVVNTTNSKQFTIQNTGAGILTVSTISIAGDAAYTLTNLPTLPVNLTTGQTATFSVQYLPTAAGATTATVTLSDNRAITTIDLQGNCIDPRITSLPHSQNFDGVSTPNLPIGWTAYKGNAGMTLTTSTTYNHTSPNSVYMFNSTYTTVPLRLISPELTVPRNIVNATFFARSGSAGVPLKFGTVSALDGTGVFTELASFTLTTTFTQYSVPMSAYEGTDIYLCFQHGNSASSQSIYLDSVVLEPLLPNDMAALSVTGPTLGIVGSPLEYTVTVKNAGTLPQASYNVHLKRYGDDRYASLPVNTPLAPGATAVHTVYWTPNTPATFSYVAEVELTGDQNAANNESSSRMVSAVPATTYFPTVGDPVGTTTVRFLPFDFFYKNSVGETIYTQMEMQMTSGTIQGMVYYNNFVTNLPATPVKIWMKHTAESDLVAGWLTFDGYTLVYDGTVHFPSGINAVYIPFSTPFNYTGGNLAIRTQRPMDAVYYSSSDVFYHTTPVTGLNRSRYIYSDSTVYDPLTINTGGTVISSLPLTTFVAPVATPVALAAPVITTTSTPTNIQLNWPVVPGAYGYRIYTSDDPYNWPTEPVSVVYTNSYTAALSGLMKFYKVVAISSYRNSNVELILNPGGILNPNGIINFTTPTIPQSINKD